MKRLLIMLFILVAVAGCGRSEEVKFQGVEAKRDYVSLGMNFLKEGDIAKAIQSFDMSIKQDPYNVNNYITLSEVYMRLKNNARAVDTLTAALRVDPNNGNIFYLLALNKMLMGEKEQAIELAKRSADLFYAEGNQDNLRRSLALIQGLVQAEGEEAVVETAGEVLPEGISVP